MKAPEKIYMPIELLSEEWTRHIKGQDIEYIRTDVFIEKVWKWLENIFHDRSHHSGRGDAGEIVTYDFDSMQEFELKFRKVVEE